MHRDSTASIPVALVAPYEVDTLTPTSERWQDPATVYELAGIATHDCCGLPADVECGCDPYEVAAFTAAAAGVFARPIMCRPASQWGA